MILCGGAKIFGSGSNDYCGTAGIVWGQTNVGPCLLTAGHVVGPKGTAVYMLINPLGPVSLQNMEQVGKVARNLDHEQERINIAVVQINPDAPGLAIHPLEIHWAIPNAGQQVVQDITQSRGARPGDAITIVGCQTGQSAATLVEWGVRERDVLKTSRDSLVDQANLGQHFALAPLDCGGPVFMGDQFLGILSGYANSRCGYTPTREIIKRLT